MRLERLGGRRLRLWQELGWLWLGRSLLAGDRQRLLRHRLRRRRHAFLVGHDGLRCPRLWRLGRLWPCLGCSGVGRMCSGLVCSGLVCSSLVCSGVGRWLGWARLEWRWLGWCPLRRRWSLVRRLEPWPGMGMEPRPCPGLESRPGPRLGDSVCQRRTDRTAARRAWAPRCSGDRCGRRGRDPHEQRAGQGPGGSARRPRRPAPSHRGR